ncbi:MAG TPA: hypothetical protein PK006_01180 [Saprospiraceae bacterium]|nr:hypothetical protein [Saprospiraceae bacterium]
MVYLVFTTLNLSQGLLYENKECGNAEINFFENTMLQFTTPTSHKTWMD